MPKKSPRNSAKDTEDERNSDDDTVSQHGHSASSRQSSSRRSSRSVASLTTNSSAKQHSLRSMSDSRSHASADSRDPDEYADDYEEDFDDGADAHSVSDRGSDSDNERGERKSQGTLSPLTSRSDRGTARREQKGDDADDSDSDGRSVDGDARSEPDDRNRAASERRERDPSDTLEEDPTVPVPLPSSRVRKDDDSDDGERNDCSEAQSSLDDEETQGERRGSESDHSVSCQSPHGPSVEAALHQLEVEEEDDRQTIHNEAQGKLHAVSKQGALMHSEMTGRGVIIQSQLKAWSVVLHNYAATEEEIFRPKIATDEAKVRKDLGHRAEKDIIAFRETEEKAAEEKAKAHKATLSTTVNMEKLKRGKIENEEDKACKDLFCQAEEDMSALVQAEQRKAHALQLAIKALDKAEEKDRKAISAQCFQDYTALIKVAHDKGMAEIQAQKAAEELKQKLEQMQAEAAEKEKRRREREAAERALLQQQKAEEERLRKEKHDRLQEEQRQRAEQQRAQREALEQKRLKRAEELALIKEEQQKEEELQQQLDQRARVLAMRAKRCLHEAEVNRRGVEEKKVLKAIHLRGRHPSPKSCARSSTRRSKAPSRCETEDTTDTHRSSWEAHPPASKVPDAAGQHLTLPPLSGARPKKGAPKANTHKVAPAFPYLPEIFGDLDPRLRPAPFR